MDTGITPPLQRVQSTANHADIDILEHSDNNSEGWYPQSVPSNLIDGSVFELNPAPVPDTVQEHHPPASISRSTVTKNLVQTKEPRPSPTFDNLIFMQFPQEQSKGQWPSSINRSMVQSKKHTQSPTFDNPSVVPTPNKQHQMNEVSLQKTEENKAGAITLLELRTPRSYGTSNTATQDLTKQPMTHVIQGNDPNQPSMITGLKPLSVPMDTMGGNNELEMSSLANEFSEKYSAKDISKFVRCLCGPAASISSSSAAPASTDVNKMPPLGITTPFIPLSFNDNPMPFAACNEASDTSVVSDISDSEMVVGKRRTNQKFTPNELSWTKRWLEARDLVTKAKQFSKVEERKIRQWMHNCRKATLNDEMIKKAWSIGIYTMYTDDEMIQNYKKIRKTLACTKWRKRYIQKRMSFSESRKKDLIERKIYSSKQLERPIRRTYKKTKHEETSQNIS